METAASSNGARRLPSRAGLLARHWALSIFALIAALALAGQSLAQIVGSGALNIERRGHTATLLEDGKILIVGGENAQDAIGQAEIFDPVTRTSAFTTGSAAARTDHTATRLSDGGALIIGGRNQAGQMDSTEIYNPLTTSFIAGPSMMRARSGHTATVLADGRILIAGGDAMGSAEIYDPASSSFALVGGSMTVSRTFHGAALLKNGQVLIAGGMDAQGTPLNTAEIYDPQSQAFYRTINDMGNPRAFALMRVLPDGKVQIIGGDSEFSMEIFDPQDGLFNGVAMLPPNTSLLGATLSTASRAALISPEIIQDALLQGVLTPEHLALLDRADHSITEIPQANQALVAGGLKSSGQVLSSATLVKSSQATITTDKTDYAPGEFVMITGTGFLPNEEVQILFHEFPDEYPDIMFNVTADQHGGFITADFAPQIIDIDKTFTLTAIGLFSGFTAQTVFTDGVSSVAITSPTSASPVTYTTLSVPISFTYTVSATGTTSATARVCSSANCNPGSTIIASATQTGLANGSSSATITVNLPDGTSNATYTAQVMVSNSAMGGAPSMNATQQNAVILNVATIAPTSLSVSPASGTYGGTVNLSATLTRTSDSTPVSGKTISFTLNGNSVGSAITNGSGVAMLSNVNLSGINAGTYPAGVGASFAGDSGFGASSGTNSLTVSKAPVTATAGSGSATYDGSPKWPSACMVTGTYTGDLTCANNPVSVGPDAGTTTIVPVVSGTGLENFEITSVNGSYTINKAPTTTVVTCPTSVVYNGLAQTPCSASVTGAGELNESLTVIYANNVNAGTATASASYAESANHLGSSGTKYFTIEKAPSVTTVTFEPGPYVYRGTPFTATAVVTGAGGLNQAVAVVYSGDCTYVTVVDGCTAAATYAGDANHHGSSDSKSITITTAFAFNGFHAPIGGSVEYGNGGSYANPLKSFKLNSTIPVKFNATWLNGSGALITGIHTLQAYKYSNETTVEGDPIDATPTDAATTGNQFRLTDAHWHFNLSTKGTGMSAGTWLLKATLVDGSTYTVWIAIKK